MGFIYKIYNDINEKVYIGQTGLTVEHRFKEHIAKARGEERKKLPIYNAMRKYGIEHFFVEQIEETEDLDEREIYWIKQYNSYENGYNATLGGGGNAKRDYQKIINLYKEYQNATTVAKLIGCERHLVYRVLKANHIKVISSAELAKKNRSKLIGQYDKNTLELIKIYPSATEAGRQIGNNGASAHIIKCANGDRKSAYGYIWKYIERKEEKENDTTTL